MYPPNTFHIFVNYLHTQILDEKNGKRKDVNKAKNKFMTAKERHEQWKFMLSYSHTLCRSSFHDKNSDTLISRWHYDKYNWCMLYAMFDCWKTEENKLNLLISFLFLLEWMCIKQNENLKLSLAFYIKWQAFN